MRTCRPAAILTLALATIALTPLGGCNPYKPGGSGQSADTFTYISDAFSPKTVSLIDTRTGETVWSYEVPVARQLTIRFYKTYKEQADPNNPDLMRWEELKPGTEYGSLRNSMNVPPAEARRIDLTVRSIPELKPN